MTGGKEDKAAMSGDHSELSDISCGLCGEIFGSCEDLRRHCVTPQHHFVLLSDEEHPWKRRPPPPLHCTPKKELSICLSHRERGECELGELCCEAHGDDELGGWRERLDFRRAKVKEAHSMPPEGYQEYALDLLWRYSSATDASAMQRIMTEELQGLRLVCRQPLHCTVSSEETELLWDFELCTITRLQRLVLLRGAHRGHFELRHLRVGAFSYNLPEGCQEWVSSLNPSGDKVVYRMQVGFQACTYGTFRQTLAFDFGGEPVLTRHFTVDVLPPDVVHAVESGRRLILPRRSRWSSTTVDVVHFAESRSASARSLCDMFPAPDPEGFQLTQSVVGAAGFSQDNYKARMHELLYVEEMARADILARYNGRVTLQITANPTADTYAQGGELFARVPLVAPVTEDTEAGRLILRSCNLVWLSVAVGVDGGGWNGGRKVFELPIHLIQKHCVYIRLTKGCVQEFGLKPRTSFDTEVQFQLDRLALCRMHYAVERLPTTGLVLPDFRIRPSPCPPEWEQSWDPRLSEQQRLAMAAIVSHHPVVGVPPILVEGPCGTGKTFVLAQALFEVIERQPGSRVLVCTHSNSAADLFVLDYLEEATFDRPALRPLRLVDELRMPDHVDLRLLPFCLEIPQDQQSKEGPWFRQPTNQELEEYRVVVTTLFASEMLIASGLKRGFFTHIFIDEATQAMEAECVLPLALADETTRIVLAGDCMQLSPEVFSPFARDHHLHVPLLERLRSALCPPPHPPLRDEDEPPPSPLPHPCWITLVENFRSHEALVRFVSDAFYGGRIRAAVASSDSTPQPHPRFHPLSFFAVRGVDQDQEGTSTSYCNSKEAGEVCNVVKQLAESWPKAWGPCDLATIAVVTPYCDQVQYIRTELREQKLARVRVETVAGVQGKEFRAVILSTVRVRATCLALEQALAKCSPEGAVPPALNFGFLSDARALNTALARAQSLVAVVGDPIALCSVGACRTMWEKFITTCAQNSSLHHMGWKEIKSVLDTLEQQREHSLQLQEKISLRHPLLTRDFSPVLAPSARHAGGPTGSRSMASSFQSMLLDDDDDDDSNDRGDSVGRRAIVPHQESTVPASQPQPSRPSSQSASQLSSSQPKKQFHGDSGRVASVGRSSNSLGNGTPCTKQTDTVANSRPQPRGRPSSQQFPSSQPPKQFREGSGRAASEGRTSNPSGNGMPRTTQTDSLAGSRARSQLSSRRGPSSRPASQVERGAMSSREFRSRGNRAGGCGRPDHTAACQGGPRPPDDRPTVAYVSAGGEGVTWEKRRLSQDDGGS